MGSPVSRQPLYRIALYGSTWLVVRPQGSLPHGFTDLEEAFAFVRTDSDGMEASVELLVDNLYMLKQIGPAR